MTNLQDAADPAASRLQQRLLIGVPIALGGLISALIVAALVVPQWMRLQADLQRLELLEELQARIPMLRSQIARTAESQSKAERQQRQLLQLIDGSGDVSAFLAQLDREASRLGVQLDLYEPVVAAPQAPAAAASGGQANQAPPPPAGSPLEAAGLKAHKVLLSAKGSYASLLAFLRATEKLSVLVTQGNLALTGGAAPQTPQPGGVVNTELKLMLTSYQSAAGATPAAAPARPQ